MVMPGEEEEEFLGVPKRPADSLGSNIYGRKKKTRLCLGTFDTAEEAALGYDNAAHALRVPDAKANLPPDTPLAPFCLMPIPPQQPPVSVMSSTVETFTVPKPECPLVVPWVIGGVKECCRQWGSSSSIVDMDIEAATTKPVMLFDLNMPSVMSSTVETFTVPKPECPLAVPWVIGGVKECCRQWGSSSSMVDMDIEAATMKPVMPFDLNMPPPEEEIQITMLRL